MFKPRRRRKVGEHGCLLLKFGVAAVSDLTQLTLAQYKALGTRRPGICALNLYSPTPVSGGSVAPARLSW